ncbi:MAG: hypothetical protein K0B81_07230 [Candidatus Cloacimonetes bacterium]|nr:hypothetical protein [Candidatus Cloacimonadota bacterium]
MRIEYLISYRISPQIYYQQNIFFKFLVVLIGIVGTLLVKWQYLPAVFIVTILWLFLDLGIISRYLKILLNILPFFISYLILGLIFKISWQEQLIFLGRITLLLLFSIFLLKTTRLKGFLQETEQLRRLSLINQMFVFALATGFFVKMFYTEIRDCKNKINKIDDVIKVVIDAFNNAYSQTDHIESKTHRLLSSKSTAESEFYHWANVYLTFLLTAYIFILAV